MSLHIWGVGYIDLVVDAFRIRIGITLSCLHNILWTSSWILTKFSAMYNWDITKNWLDFGDNLIFKVTAAEKLKIPVGGRGTSVFSENTFTSLILSTNVLFLFLL